MPYRPIAAEAQYGRRHRAGGERRPGRYPGRWAEASAGVFIVNLQAARAANVLDTVDSVMKEMPHPDRRQ